MRAIIWNAAGRASISGSPQGASELRAPTPRCHRCAAPRVRAGRAGRIRCSSMSAIDDVPVPRGRTRTARSSVLQSIAVATSALSRARASAATRRPPTTRLQAGLDRADTEIALLIEDLAVEDDRMGRVPPPLRPHYGPTQRMRIPWLEAARRSHRRADGGGLWVRWAPVTTIRGRLFCWWAAVVIGRFSRRLIGFALSNMAPSSTRQGRQA